MRDVVEIGIGREAVRTYELEDISLVPSRPLCSHREVSLVWKMLTSLIFLSWLMAQMRLHPPTLL